MKRTKKNSILSFFIGLFAIYATAQEGYHIVEKGETYYSIAKEYGLNVQKLIDLNKIEPRFLKVGTRLKINKNSTIGNGYSTHIVKRKETLYRISKKYNLSVSELKRLNPGISARNLRIGYELIIRNKNRTVTQTQQTTPPPNTSTNSTTNKVNRVVYKAKTYIGTRYKSGGTTSSGFDCSGLMCTSFKAINVTLPRTSRAQAQYGKKISKNKAKKGDLIFFATGRSSRINHVGLITEVKNGTIKFIHSSTSLGVIISSLNERYYASRFVQVTSVL